MCAALPLIVSPGRNTPADDLNVEAIAEYLPTLVTSDWEFLRAGRVVYEGACAACHGAYGNGGWPIVLWLGVPDLLTMRDHYGI